MDVATASPRLLHDADEIAREVRALAGRVAAALDGRPAFVVPVMNGALFFAADFLRALPAQAPLAGYGAACVASYGADLRPDGPPRVVSFPAAERLAGRTVVVLDTVVDTGGTAAAVVERARAAGAQDVRLVCLLDKPARRRHDVVPDDRAFVAPDLFLVGYGLDAGGRWRTLPWIGALDV